MLLISQLIFLRFFQSFGIIKGQVCASRSVSHDCHCTYQNSVNDLDLGSATEEVLMFVPSLEMAVIYDSH